MISSIKKKFIFIYLLNISDIIFTMLLLKTGAFIEGNLFMRGIVKNIFLSYFIKLGVPALLLYIIYIRIKKANEKQLKIGNLLINGCLIFYITINLSHIVFTLLYNTYFI